MSQGWFFVLLLGIAGSIIALGIAFSSLPELSDQCSKAGGELVVVRSAKPICIRRDALIALP